MRAADTDTNEGFFFKKKIIIYITLFFQLVFFFFIWYICVLLAVKSKAPDKAPAGGGSSFNQLLGIKGAAQETVILYLQTRFLLLFFSLVLADF